MSRSEETRSFLLLSTEELEKYKAANTRPPPEDLLAIIQKKQVKESWLSASHTSQWAWGAVSALTTSAAKLVTTAGSALGTSDLSHSDSSMMSNANNDLSWLQLRRKSYQSL